MSTVHDRTLIGPLASPTSRPGVVAIAIAGPVAGAALGVVARAWMRLIADDPDFSWSGTIFIVLAFTIAGAGHGLAWAARRARARRRWSTPARVIAAVTTLPIFTGAGALMLPTVVCATLAGARPDWPRPVRVVIAMLAGATPIMIVLDVADGGLTPPRALGVVLFIATYALIVRSLYGTIAPLADGWRMPRALRTVTVVAAVLTVLLVATFAVGLATAGA